MIRAIVTASILAITIWMDGSAQTRGGWSPSLALTAGSSLELDDAVWGVGVSGELLRRKGRLTYGAEIGFQSLGTHTTRIEYFDNQAGWVLTEDVTRSLIRVALLGRWELAEGGLRPYLLAGVGAYNTRFRDRITVLDANGNRVPFYDFSGSGQDIKPALSAGAGLTLTRLRSGPSLGLEARWHGLVAVMEGGGLGTADILTFGLSLRW